MSETQSVAQPAYLVPLDSAWSMVKQSWKWFNDHLKMLLQLSFIAAIPTIVLDLVVAISKDEVTSGVSTQNFGLVIGLGVGFFLWGMVNLFWSFLGTIAIYQYIHKPETTKTAWQYFLSDRQFVVNYFSTSIIYGLIIFGGILLFLFPGIFWAVTFSFAPLVSIFEKATVSEALKRSKQMIRAQWFDVFWRGILMGITILAVSVLAGIIFDIIGKVSTIAGVTLDSLLNVVLTPLPLIMLYLLYSKLSVKKA